MTPSIDVRTACRRVAEQAFYKCNKSGHGTPSAECVADEYTKLLAPLVEALEFYAQEGVINSNTARIARSALAEVEKAGK